MNILNRAIVGAVQLMPKSIVRFFSARYIAGDALNDAVAVVKKLNAQGIMATIDVLGEAISTRNEALTAKQECLQVLAAIREHNLNANLSIKPTQMGLLLDEEYCYAQVEELILRAAEFGNFVRLDMEDSSTTDKIYNLYRRLRRAHGNTGVVVQAYLRRTYDDVAGLNKLGANYRLCKGIYIEPEAIAFKGRQEVRDNYMKCLKLMLEDGRYVGIATHDEYLIDASLELVKKMNVARENFEFQMLLGVREDLRDKINKAGFRIRVYVPFGEHWYLYSIRRLKENPNIAWHIFKNIFGLK